MGAFWTYFLDFFGLSGVMKWFTSPTPTMAPVPVRSEVTQVGQRVQR